MAEIEQYVVHLEPDAADLLAKLVPNVEQRSRYVGDLIQVTAAQRGLIEPADDSTGLQCFLASHEVLARSWLGPEEDAAWRDLPFEQ